VSLLKASFQSLPLEILKLLIVSTANYFAANQWTTNTMYASLLVISSMVAYIGLTWVFQIRRPIMVDFKLSNSKTKKENTEIHKTSKEKELTIKVDFQLERRLSVFWRFGLLLIKNKRIHLKVFPTSDELVLIPKNRAALAEITDCTEGFMVDLSELFKNSLMENKAFPHRRSYGFFVQVKRGIDVTPDRHVEIHSKLLINDKPAGALFSILFDTKYGSHGIEIYP
jgi:hypothetical protein